MSIDLGFLSASLPVFFFFNDTATTEIYTLSLHDALPIFGQLAPQLAEHGETAHTGVEHPDRRVRASCYLRCWVTSPDRKSTRLNSSHDQISYAVFCLKKKKTRSRETLPAQRRCPSH